MSKGTLYITNAQAARQLVKAGGLDGDLVLWEDQLYAGPVPAGLGPEDLVVTRCRYFAEQGYGGDMVDSEKFSRRLRQLAGVMDYRQVIMLFEDSLKDQLLLVQLLDFFSGLRMPAGFLRAYVVADDLGLMPLDEILACFSDAEAVTGGQLGVGRQAWRAFRSSNPRDFERLQRNQATAELPAFRDNIRRLLQEYPWRGNSLNRTQHQILETIRSGVSRPVNIYLACQDMEEAPFMDVRIFWRYLNEFLSCTPAMAHWNQGEQLPLPENLQQARQQEGSISITQEGKDILNNRLNWLDLVSLDKWYGGVHLDRGNPWFWSEHDNQLLQGRR